MRLALSDIRRYAPLMRTLILLICVVTSLTASGCKNRWEMKWPGRGKSAATTQPRENDKPKTATTQPSEPTAVTPQQEIAQLQRQIKTLRERLDFIEDENAKLRNSSKPDKSVEDLQKALKLQTFTAKMQAEDLKVLKTAAVERDLYKTRSERMERENADLKTRIANLTGKQSAENVEADPGKTPATQPARP